MPDLVNGSKTYLDLYYITEILLDVHNSKYGDIIVVYANPAWEGEFGMWEYTVGIHGETECFLFANNPLIKEQIEKSYNNPGNCLWAPDDEGDYRREKCFNMETGTERYYHIHSSLF